MGGSRVAAPTVTERIAAVVDERVEQILGAYLDGLRSDDEETRMKAADRLLNRRIGTPKQSVDVAHSGGLTIEALFVGDPLAETHTELPEEGE